MRVARVVAACAAVLSLSLSPLAANAAKIAVIGTGNVANALGPGFAAQGNTIVYGSRNPSEQKVKDLIAKTGHGATAASDQDAVKGADIVVIAVPGTAITTMSAPLTASWSDAAVAPWPVFAIRSLTFWSDGLREP